MSESQTPKPEPQTQKEESFKHVEKLTKIVNELKKFYDCPDYLVMVRASEVLAEVGLVQARGLETYPAVTRTFLMALIKSLESEGYVVYAIAYEEGYIKVKAITPRK